MNKAILTAAILLTACSRAAAPEANEPAVEEPANVAVTQPEMNTVGAPAVEPPVAAPAAGACDMQDGKKLPPIRLQGIGTEPFWGTMVEGRCVTYSHPEDQAGTRVWTKFSGSAESGTWTGNLGGKPFVMATRPEADCNDGMSDNRYPIAVALTVGGEKRSGCAYAINDRSRLAQRSEASQPVRT